MNFFVVNNTKKKMLKYYTIDFNLLFRYLSSFHVINTLENDCHLVCFQLHELLFVIGIILKSLDFRFKVKKDNLIKTVL